jgi:hypothetical protein
MSVPLGGPGPLVHPEDYGFVAGVTVAVVGLCLALALAFAAGESYAHYVHLMDRPITQGTDPLPPPKPRARR